MTVFIKYTDPLLVHIDNSPAGENWNDNRAQWFGLENVTFNDGGLSGTQWYRSQGPIGMAQTIQEPRAFCTRGGLIFSFTGTTIIMRLNVAWSWYTAATVLIDGVAPSTIPDLYTAIDTVSCDAATYGLFNDSYVDVLVADGLTDEVLHTLQIIVDNNDATKFFSMSGYKVGRLAPRNVRGHVTYIRSPITVNLEQNWTKLTVTNRQDIPIVNIALTLPSSMMNADGSLVTPLEIDVLPAGASEDKLVAPIYGNDWQSGDYTFSVNLFADYPDPGGVVPIDTAFSVGADSPLLTFTPVPWFTDTATPTSVPRRFATARDWTGEPWKMSFTFKGDALDVEVQRSAGWGIIGIYDGDDNLLNTVDCSVDEGGALHTYNLTGFGAGTHEVFFRKTVDDALPVVFVKASWIETATYTHIDETFDVVMRGQQPIPMPPVNITIGDYLAEFDNPIVTDHDYDAPVPRTNSDVAYTETVTRFPTFAVFYGTGFREMMSGYDVLIVDPLGARVSDVQYWQSLGIKVYGYISSGEEVGFYQQPFNFSSPLAPRSGSGPGGYSENYMFTKFPDTGPPDRNAIWASYYMNPFPESGWLDRCINYYAPQCFGGQVVVIDEDVTTITATTSIGPGVVFQTAQSPLDGDETITVKSADGSHTYDIYRDYTFDIKTGCFVIAPTASPAVTAGDHLLISYTRKGHQMDGVFWDTVDTPDVFESDAFGYEHVPGYAEAFAQMLNDFGATFPDKEIVFNRGFTILDDIIAGASGVMFESWLSLPIDPYNLPTTGYYRVDDPQWVDYNNQCNAQLARLRKEHVFEVYSLNYAKAGPEGDEMRAYCRRMDSEYGYQSWQTIITLNNPNHNDPIDQSDPSVTTNIWHRYQTKAIDPE